jgi:UDP-2,3-diacylglucosamine hydrolase
MFPTQDKAFHRFVLPAHWRRVDFISDLHLSPGELDNTQAWQRYMGHTDADALFILGDWFDVWVGDDVPAGGFEAACAQTVHEVVARGVEVFVMHGNRDFLMGQAYLNRCRAQFLPDPTVLLLDAHPTQDKENFSASQVDQGEECPSPPPAPQPVCLISHGDAWCTRDTAYQHFRQQVRQPAWQEAFLAQPRWQREAQGRALRAQSRAAQSSLAQRPEADVETATLQAFLQHTGLKQISNVVHGHTHRPADYEITLENGQKAVRRVLSDWQAPQRAEVLRWWVASNQWQRVNI